MVVQGKTSLVYACHYLFIANRVINGCVWPKFHSGNITHLNFPPKSEFREITSSLWHPGISVIITGKVIPRPRRQSSSRGENLFPSPSVCCSPPRLIFACGSNLGIPQKGSRLPRMKLGRSCKAGRTFFAHLCISAYARKEGNLRPL